MILISTLWMLFQTFINEEDIIFFFYLIYNQYVCTFKNWYFFYINSNEIFKLIFSYKKSLIDQLLRKKKKKSTKNIYIFKSNLKINSIAMHHAEHIPVTSRWKQGWKHDTISVGKK
jgi:hypothetical protein